MFFIVSQELQKTRVVIIFGHSRTSERCAVQEAEGCSYGK
jgi:hypothetical protein